MLYTIANNTSVKSASSISTKIENALFFYNMNLGFKNKVNCSKSQQNTLDKSQTNNHQSTGHLNQIAQVGAVSHSQDVAT